MSPSFVLSRSLSCNYSGLKYETTRLVEKPLPAVKHHVSDICEWVTVLFTVEHMDLVFTFDVVDHPILSEVIIWSLP